MMDSEAVIMPTMSNCCFCNGVMSGETALLLPCLHTICEKCCIADADADGNVVCKLCDKVSSAQSVQKHFLLKVVEEATNVQKCNGCDEGIPAIFKCIDCNGDFLCKDCVFAHKRVRLTKEHRLEEVLKPYIINDFCPNHNDPKIVYCTTCDKFLCFDCLAGSHLGHKFESSEHGVMKNQQELEEAINCSEINQVIDVILQRIQEVRNDQAKMKREVSDYTKTVQLALERRENRLNLKIDEVCSKQMKLYEIIKTNFEKLKYLMNYYKEFAESTGICPNKVLVTQAMALISNAVNAIRGIKETEFSASNNDIINKAVHFELKSSKCIDQLLKQIEFDSFVLSNGIATDDSTIYVQSRTCSPIPNLLQNNHTIPSSEATNIFDQVALRSPNAQYTVTRNICPDNKNANGTLKRKLAFEENGNAPCKENVNESAKRIYNGKASFNGSHSFNNPLSIFDCTDAEVDGYSVVSGLKSSGNHAVSQSPINDEEHLNDDNGKEWEDFCLVCQKDTGDFLKCSAPGCTRVFHRYDHIPVYSDAHQFSDKESFVCGFCRNYEALKTPDDNIKKEIRKSAKLTPYERAIAERILLELYCYCDSEPFHENVDRAYQAYYDVITRPIALVDVREFLSNKAYKKMETFLNDVNQIFANCFAFYEPNSDRYQKGKSVAKYLRDLVETYIPNYLPLIEVSKEGDYTPRALRKRP